MRQLTLKQTAMPTASMPMTSPQLVTPKSKFGGQLRETSLSVLRDVHTHPGDQHPQRAKRLGAVSNLSSRINNLVSAGYMRRVMQGGRPVLLALTAKGGRAIDVDVADEPPPIKEARICNAAMRGTPLDLSRHTHMGRIGLAMCGASGR